MPTDIYTYYEVFSNPSELIRRACQYALELTRAYTFGITPEWTLDIFQGAPAMLVTFGSSSGGGTDSTGFALKGVDAGTGAPPAYILDAPGLSGSVMVQGSADMFTDWGSVQSQIEAFVEDGLIPFIQGITGVECNIIYIGSLVDVVTSVGTIAITMSAEGDFARIWTPSLGFSVNAFTGEESEPNLNWQVQGSWPVQNGVGTIQVSPAGLNEIAEALWTIAMRDESLSINQNGPIWSAKGRMTTG